MFGPELRAWLLGLDAQEAVEVIGALLRAEADRLSLDLGTVTFPTAIYVKDGGVDGRSELPHRAVTIFPTGPRAWQVKTGGTPEFEAEVAKPAVQHELTEGRDYVCVWFHEWVSATKTLSELEDEVSMLVKATHPDREAQLILADDIERLANAHPAVVAVYGGPTLAGLPLEVWGRSLEPDRFPFQLDASRADQIEAIRGHVRNNPASIDTLEIIGDNAVGKSRLIYEALAVDGIRDRVMAMDQLSQRDEERLGHLLQAESASAVVVVDDGDTVTSERVVRLAKRSQGRLRSIVISDRPFRSAGALGSTLEVQPLPDGAVAELVKGVTGLGSEEAELIASLAQGYPKLALEMAEAAVSTARTGVSTVLDLLRSLRVGVILQEMLPDRDSLRHLAHLALVERLGFFDELDVERTAFCQAFALDERQFTACVLQEENRLVTRVGRYVRVTPKALAVWLVAEQVRGDPAGYAEVLLNLPDQFFTSFREQMELLSGDATMDDILKEVLVRRAESFRSASDLTEGGARLLLAAAYALPEVAAAQLHSLLSNSTDADIGAIADGRRRDLVWASDHLLWFQTTFAEAADCLMRLAVNESETWSNNATGTLQGAFQLNLGGTEVPIDERLDWLTGSVEAYGEPAAKVAIGALSAVLSLHQGRIGGWRGARPQPQEWRPTQPEAIAACRRAIQQAHALVATYPSAQNDLAEFVKTLLWRERYDGMVHDLEPLLREVDWSIENRASLLAAARRALDLEALAPGSIAAVQQLIADWSSGDSLGRMRLTLTTSYWDLARESDGEGFTPPSVIDELAALAMSDARLVAEVAQPRDKTSETTLYNVARAIGLLDDDGVWQPTLVTTDARSEARAGYVVGRGEHDAAWLDQLLDTWVHTPELVSEVALIVSRQLPTEQRAQRALSAVVAGADARSLKPLAYGDWTKGLSVDVRLAMVHALVGAGEADAVRAALLMLESLVADGNGANEAVLDVIQHTSTIAAGMRDQSLAYHYERLVRESTLSVPKKAGIVIAALTSGELLWPNTVSALEELAREDPTYMAQTICELLEVPARWQIWLHSEPVLSRLARGAGTGPVIERIAQMDDAAQRRMLAYVDYETTEPDPLLVALLELRPDPEYWHSAAGRYTYPSGVTIGSMAVALERRRETPASMGE